MICKLLELLQLLDSTKVRDWLLVHGNSESLSATHGILDLGSVFWASVPAISQNQPGGCLVGDGLQTQKNARHVGRLDVILVASDSK